MKHIKILVITLLCALMLVGCGKKTALDITKENYEKYGYEYARIELKRMIEESPDGKKYSFSDLREASDFIIEAEHGTTADELMEDIKRGN